MFAKTEAYASNFPLGFTSTNNVVKLPGFAGKKVFVVEIEAQIEYRKFTHV